MKTVLCHFFNEEHLLPWWLDHHKKIFDHGIMIDYASTDSSRDIIKKICPTWEIRPSRNEYFTPKDIDAEVMDIEATLTDWRICLNATEFLYGNTDHLVSKPGNKFQYMLANYVFVDMEDPAKGPVHLSHDKPLHKQRYWGYFAPDYPNKEPDFGRMAPNRLNRAIHNFTIPYFDDGRHYPDTVHMFDDLAIFYYGHADTSEAGIKRKEQIKSKVARDMKDGHHNRNCGQFVDEIQNRHRPKSIDLTEKIKHICSYQYPDEISTVVIDESIQNVTELAVTYEGTVVEIPATDSKLIQAEPRVIG